MKKIPVKEVGGVLTPAQPLPSGIEVLCDGKFYYVLEPTSSTSTVAYKEFKAHKDRIKLTNDTAQALVTVEVSNA